MPHVAYGEFYALAMRTHRSRLLAMGVAAISGLLLFATSGCSIAPREFPPSGANEPEVVAARQAAAAAEEELLAATALGEPISTSVQDYCQSGTYSEPWGPRDPYFWACGHVTSWVVGTDLQDPAELIAAYRAHFASIGCELSETSFDRTAEYWATYGVPGENSNGERYTVDNLPSAGALCSDGAEIGIGFRSGADFEASRLVRYYLSDGEQITDQPHDQAAVRANGGLIVTLITGTPYHYVPRGGTAPSGESTPEPQHCACYSGSECDCPGG